MAHSEQPKRQGILKPDSSEVPSITAQAGSASHTPKSVSINPRGEHISPLILGDSKDVDELDLDRPRVHRVKGPASKRLSGKPSTCSSASSLRHWSDEGGELPAYDMSDFEPYMGNSGDQQSWVAQIAQWIRDEKLKRDARYARRTAQTPASIPTDPAEDQKRHPEGNPEHHPANGPTHQTHSRAESTQSVDLDALEQILKDIPVATRHARRKMSASIRRRLHRRLSSAGPASSDTEYYDGDVLVPSAEVVLDNSCTLSYTGGAAQCTDDLSLDRSTTASEEAWLKFKAETLRLIHTLRLKGWRRVPPEMSPELTICRLSGALTNAVYVVTPPDELPEPVTDSGTSAPASKRKPAKLLLRIYGPQVEHLIDRRSELQILGRLARKHIGPRMLGTFCNGRFEEFFNAAPLTPQELRNSDTSRHIAKRMRELHDGMELMASERADGPFVWRNWDKWLGRVNKITQWLDEQTLARAKAEDTAPDFVCGTEWAFFHDTVYKYRKWLEDKLGGPRKLGESMVFAHNDTQYGNILRIIPSSTSPLLMPANSHKQLIVIDFEYANANTPGFEFANHFSEWCYNYHDEATPWRCTQALYPTPEEQARFIRAYVRHRPDFNITTPLMTPTTEIAPSLKGPGSISNFMLDARGPPTPTEDPYAAQEDASVKQLMQNTRLWRMAASAQWVAWGIVQARMPGMPTFDDGPDDNAAKPVSPSSGPVDAAEEADAEAAEEEFDYLAYTRDRAMLFWGDALEMGLVTAEQVSEAVRRDAKRLKY